MLQYRPPCGHPGGAGARVVSSAGTCVYRYYSSRRDVIRSIVHTCEVSLSCSHPSTPPGSESEAERLGGTC